MSLRRALPLLVAMVPAFSGCGDAPGAAGILLVSIDTCRADRIGCYGAGHADTPFIDGLAERGTVYLQAAAPAPLTLPSHLSLLTGLYPDRHGVRDNGAGRLPDAAVTIAEVLGDRGWRTGGFIAAVPIESRYGTAQGFDHYDDDFITGDPQGDVLNRMETDQRTADQVADAALPWLRDAVSSGEPFLAWVHFFDPHAPYAPPGTWAQRYGAGSYDGEVAFVDEQIGRLLDALGDAAPRTIVAVTADHGESLGEHGEATHGFLVYESALRIPWVLAGPGVPAGRREEAPVSLVDVMPTLLDAVGVSRPDGLDGASVLASPPERDVFGEALFGRLNFGWSAARSIRSGSWKFVESHVPELFDLASDPGETRDVSAEHPDRVAQLRSRLHAHHARGGALATEPIAADEGMRERLEGLGYIGTGGDALATEPIAADEGMRERLEGLGYIGTGGDALEEEDDLWEFDAGDPRDMVRVFDDMQVLPTLIMSRRDAEAEALVGSLLERAPGNVAILRRVSQLWSKARNWPAAIDAAKELLQLDPDDAEARHALAAAYLRAGDTGAARETFREAARRDPADARAAAGVGVLHAVAGECAAAAAWLRRVGDLPAEDAQVLADVASAWKECGRDDEALAEYDRALSVNRRYGPAWNGKALVYSHGGRAPEAVAVLRDALRLLPEDVETLNNLAWILADAGIDPAEAVTHAAKAADLAPQDASVLDTLGWAAIRAGRAAEAVAPLRAALDATRDAEVRAHLGIALAESGRVEEGRAMVRAAVAERGTLAGIPEVQKWR